MLRRQFTRLAGASAALSALPSLTHCLPGRAGGSPIVLDLL
jgi:hypothetical protein